MRWCVPGQLQQVIKDLTLRDQMLLLESSLGFAGQTSPESSTGDYCCRFCACVASGLMQTLGLSVGSMIPCAICLMRLTRQNITNRVSLYPGTHGKHLSNAHRVTNNIFPQPCLPQGVL